MSNNSICIDSPFFKAPAAFNPQVKQEVEMEQDDLNRLIFGSPEIVPPNFKLPYSSHPLTPWSPLLNIDNQCHSGQLSLPSIFPNQNHKDQEIKDLIIYSDVEDEENLMTPIKQQSCDKADILEAELHTTGRKQSIDPLQISKTSRPRERGLRKLSQRAFEVVQNLRNATYKDVASKLVMEVHQEEGESGAQSREEQNIKRRVYDALNVLIALGALKKDGRKIVSQRAKFKKNGPGYQQTQELRRKIAFKQSLLAEKKKKLKDSEEKLQAIRFLLFRNQQEKHHKSIVRFPFIGLNPGDALVQTEQPSKSELIIRTSYPIQPFGDIDSLKWIREATEIFDGVSLF